MEFSRNCFLIILLLFSINLVVGQANNRNETFFEQYEKYFKSDRKTVHLHLNKTQFITGEHIWFRTFLYNQTKSTKSQEEEYIYVDLIDNNGNVINKKTVLFKNGFGKGDFLLPEELDTGHYYLQAYTSNMQNFEEDESTIYPIQIKNLTTGHSILPDLQSYRDSLKMTIAAESGNLIEGLFSTLAVKITNSYGFGVQPDSLFLIDEKNQKLNSITIDNRGFGTFSILPEKHKKYRLIGYQNKNLIEEHLPLHQTYGHNISIDRNHPKEQLIVTLNSKPKFKEGLTLVLHKDGNIVNLPSLKTDTEKQAILLSYDVLNQGVNTISLLNQEGQLLAERSFFHRPKINLPNIELKKVASFKDSVSVAFKASPSLKNHTISASVLPGETNKKNDSKKAFYSIHLERYFNLESWKNLSELSYQDSKELYYLDGLCIFAKRKYNWKNILNNSLVVPHQREQTSTLEGYVKTSLNTADSLQILLYSKENELLANTALDSEKKFVFENLVLAKGSKISLTLSSKKGKPVYANFFYTIKPSISNFRHHYAPQKIALPKDNNFLDESKPSRTLNDIQELEEVTVSAKRLKYQKFFKAYFGVKVDSTIGMTTLKDFLSQQGYNSIFISNSYPDPRRAGQSQTGKASNRCGYIFPTITFDGKFDRYIDSYINTRMEFIDEIYFDRPTSCSATVVVFTNEKYKNRPLSESEKKSKEFIVDNGYHVPKSFERPDYFNTNDDTFKQFGVLAWEPSLSSQSNALLKLTAPLDNQNTLRVSLETITNNGDFVSKDFVVDLRK